MSSSEPPPAVVVQVPPGDAEASDKRGQVIDHLDALERRLDSMNVVAGILLAGFGLLLTIIFNINFPSGQLYLLSVIPISDDTVNNLLLLSVLITLASAICCVIFLYTSLLMRGGVTLAALDSPATDAHEQLLSEARKRTHLVRRNRLFLALTTTGYLLELTLTLTLVDIDFRGPI
jgi:hypothetical protein